MSTDDAKSRSSAALGMAIEEENWVRRRGQQGEERFLSGQVDTSQERSGKASACFARNDGCGGRR